MMTHPRVLKRFWLGLGLAGLLLGSGGDSQAGDRRYRGRSVAVVPAARVRVSDPNKTLGTFGSTPYLIVRGNGVIGGGYSPGDMYGDVAMDINGPLSAYRSISAPVLTYSRGYNGALVPSVGTSFSNPNLPSMSPVVYPTQANNYYGFPVSGSPPWWAKASSFIDGN